MKGIVWCNILQDGLEKLNDIKNDYVQYGMKVTREQTTNYSSTICFENGDIWTVVKASDHARGHCCNISYIDRSIPKDIIDCIIKPCTKAFPYRAYNYYGESVFNVQENNEE